MNEVSAAWTCGECCTLLSGGSSVVAVCPRGEVSAVT